MMSLHPHDIHVNDLPPKRKENPYYFLLSVLSDGSSGHYKIHRDGVYEPYLLTISDVQYSDRGFYYCCLPSNCSDNVEDNCQRFILRVRGKIIVQILFTRSQS